MVMAPNTILYKAITFSNKKELIVSTPENDVVNINTSDCIVISKKMDELLQCLQYQVACAIMGDVNSLSQQSKELAHLTLINHIVEMDEQCFYELYQRFHHLPVTITITNRLELRELTLSDFDRLYQLYQQPSHKKYLEPMTDYEQEYQKFAAYVSTFYSFHHFGLWGIFLRSSGQMIGRCGFMPTEYKKHHVLELSYHIDESFTGLGLATEAVLAAIEYARDYQGIVEFYVRIAQGNNASIALATRIGMTLVDGMKQGMNECLWFQYHG